MYFFKHDAFKHSYFLPFCHFIEAKSEDSLAKMSSGIHETLPISQDDLVSKPIKMSVIQCR